MKRNLTLAILAIIGAGTLVSCSEPPPPRHIHHYSTRTYYRSNSYGKPASVGGTSVDYNTPEGFQAVSPPASYSY